MRYILMNKDEPWALFSCIQDEFGEESAVLQEWYTELRPLGLQSLTAWLEKRKAPKHRKHIEQLLEQYGCIGLEGFLQRRVPVLHLAGVRYGRLLRKMLGARTGRNLSLQGRQRHL